MAIEGSRPSPESVREILRQAARSTSPSQRARLLQPLPDLYASLERDTKQIVTASRFEQAGVLSASIFSSQLKKELEQGNEEQRSKAAATLAEAYDALSRHYGESAPVEVEASGEYGGRSGQVLFRDKPPIDNPSLAQFLDAEVSGRPTRVPSPAAGTPAICRHFVTVSKPGNLVEVRGAGLDPEFLFYLKTRSKLSLRSYQDWLAGRDPSDENRLGYEQELAQAREEFDAEHFQRRYCKPMDLPAPGGIRGSRLLRLTVPIGLEDFRLHCGPHSIYEGPLGPPAPPELDYDELVRRYVSLMRLQPVFYYDLWVGGPVIGEAHKRELLPFDALVLRLLMVASIAALRQPEGLLKILNVITEGTQPLAGGRGPLEIGEWLRSADALPLRTLILNAWKWILEGLAQPPTSAAAGPPQLPERMIPLSEFVSRIIGVCLPGRSAGLGCPEDAELDFGTFTPARFFQSADVSRAADPAAIALLLKDELDDLAQIYDSVWSAARNNLGDQGLWEVKEDIKLSPLEMRAYLYQLSLYALLAHPDQKVRLVYFAPGAQPGGNFAQTVASMNLPIAGFDVMGPSLLAGFDVMGSSLPAVHPPSRRGESAYEKDFFWETNAQAPGGPCTGLTSTVRGSLLAVIGSYRNAFDAALSFIGLDGGGVASPQQPGIGGLSVKQSDLPVLYDRWLDSFVRLLQQIVDERQQIPDNLLVLRLTQRSGRYREVPQRTQLLELQNEPKAQPWPGHPARKTEGYVLEPVPERYYSAYYPAIFLREDYSLDFYHRGYGIGQHIYSVSLLPEEEQTIVSKSFKDTKTKVTESTAENIFEERGSETADDFATEMAAENQRETNSQEDYHVSGNATTDGIPFVNIHLESAYNAQNSVKDFAKNTNNLTRRLASKFSAKRTVTVDTKREQQREEELHSELNTERKIKNPNMGHTVTFHWFQVTRKLNQELTLEDVKMVYTSGKHNIIRIYKKGDPPALAKLPGQRSFSEMPPDVARRLPPGSAIVLVMEPYTEVVSMAGANAFLARVFRPEKAVDLNSTVWQVIGAGAASPDGLGVAAFPGRERGQLAWTHYTPLYSADPFTPGDPANPLHVAADLLTVRQIGGPPGAALRPMYLPNLDLRYQLREGLVPSRYAADPFDGYSLPRLLSAEERILNTNGVFCDAQVGQCPALEDYLQQSRELELREKTIQVGTQEIEFKWALARDGLVEISQDRDRALVAIVKEQNGGQPFASRLEVEKEQLAEKKSIAEARLEKQRLERELDLLTERINEARKKVEILGQPPEVRIEAPEGSGITVNADVLLGQPPKEPQPGGTIKVE